MKITGISIWHVDLTSHKTYYMADGKTCDTVESVVVRLDTDAGIVGWGEHCVIPHYLPSFSRGIAPAITEMAPEILGHNPMGAPAFMHRLDKWLIGHDAAKSAVDMALWDINAKVAGQPLYNLLGGKFADAIPTYHSITCIEPEDMVEIAKEAYASGIRQFQCKLGADNQWEKDVARLRKVREAVGNGPLVYGDWNCGSNKLDAIRVGRAVADLDIMLEQPCATLEECASVKSATSLPMKIDENAKTLGDLMRANELDCLDAVALKISKFGGLSASVRARDLCCYLGGRMCVEDTWGSDIVTAASLHLAASTPPERIMNVCDLSGYVGPRLDPNSPTRKDGCIGPNDKPGLGVEPDLDTLGAPDVVLD